MIIVAEIVFDSGTRYYSEMGIGMPGRFYEPRLQSVSGLGRSIPVIPGQINQVTASITLFNADNEFSKLRSSEQFRRRTVNILVGHLEDGLSNFTTIFSGVIANWRITATACTFDIEETLLRRFNATTPGAITTAAFPHLPDTTPRVLVPLVMGDVNAPTGAVPAYRVDPAVGQSKYRYVAAQTAIKEISEVYVYGVLQSSGYTVTTLAGALPDPVTVIDFDTDPLDSDRGNELTVTWNGRGMTDDKTATGADVANPVDQVEDLWVYHGLSASLLDSSSFAATSTAVTSRGFSSGFCEIDPAQSLRVILERFADSFNLSFYTTPAGKLGVSFPLPEPASTAGLTEIKEQDSLDAFEVTGPIDVASRLVSSFDYNWALEQFESLNEYDDSAQQAALNDVLTLDALDLYYVRDTGTQIGVVSDRLFFAQEQREVLILETCLNTITCLVTIGDNVLITHRSGIAASGGYDQAPFRVIDQEIVLGQDEARVALTLVSLSAANFEASLTYLTLKDTPMRFRHNRHAMTTERNYGRVVA